MELGKPNWLTSKELIESYGLKISRGNEARAAKRIVKDFDLPWYREGNRWKTTDPNLMAMLRKETE